MKIKDIVVEINGIRHKLIKSRATKPCDSCSMNKYCNGTNANVFVRMCSTMKGPRGKFVIQK